jgi:hypothetical protein
MTGKQVSHPWQRIYEASRLTIADIVPTVEATLDSSCVALSEELTYIYL